MLLKGLYKKGNLGKAGKTCKRMKVKKEKDFF